MQQTGTDVSAMLKSGVILEIYPRSFRAGRSGRHGDLRGIVQKLDYLDWLGVQKIWLPPIYPSPMQDGGYDVTDYFRIHNMYGSLTDFDELVEAADKRGIGLIMDLVVNHTSTEHEWFQEAIRSSRSPFRDRYIFKPGNSDGTPPSNHLSVFKGSAWEQISGTNDFYYHTFAPGQPDLNYDHPVVLAEMRRVMRFWFDRGVKGIRVDAVHYIGKSADMPDEPLNPNWNGENKYESLLHTHTQYQPRTFELMSELCKVATEYDDRFVVFEASVTDGKHSLYKRMYEAMDRSVGAPFHLGLFIAEWSAESIKSHVQNFMYDLPHDAVPVWNVSNHDQRRVASRIGEQQAWVAMALMLTLPGVPTLYYGDEIGMTDGPDVPSGLSDDPRENEFSRDVARTVMQWSDDAGAGFTDASVKPWNPQNPDYKTKNVEAQKLEPTSMLNFTKQLIELRRSIPALELGEYVELQSGAQGVFAFGRRLEDDQITVLLNFTNTDQIVDVPANTPNLLFGQRGTVPPRSNKIHLRPNEVCLLKS